MDVLLDQIAQSVGANIPKLVGAVAILIIGWLVALVVSGIVGRALHRTKVDDRLSRWITGKEPPEGVESKRWVARGVFWLIMLLVLVAFFQVLDLTLITEPFNRLLNEVFQYAPRLVGAGVLLLIAWIVARVLKFMVSRGLTAAKLDERLISQADIEEERRIPLAKSISEAVYWLVFLLFLPAVLGALGLEGLLEPVRDMLDKILTILPNLFAAGLVLLVGWFVARILQRIVTNLLSAIGTDQLSEKVGLASALGKQRLSGLIGLVVYILILIPVVIAALNILQLEAITTPASNMLNTVLGALPGIFAAGLLLVIAYVVGRLVARLTTNLLTGAGFNTLLVRLGLGKEPVEGRRTLSEIVGYIVLVAIMLFATIEASRLLGFLLLADLVTQFTFFAGQVIMGLIIFAIGLLLAELASKTVQSSGAAQSRMLAMAARVSILVLAGAMALRQMGLANEIVNIAFGLLFGTIAVAAALSFGLGGREIAARKLKEWIQSEESKKSNNPEKGKV